MIEMTRATPAARAYWWIALGVLDALAAGGLPDADEAKRFAMRLGGRSRSSSKASLKQANSNCARLCTSPPVPKKEAKR